MIRIAVLGCGRIGVMHAANIAAHPRAVLAGVFDIHAPAAQAVAVKTGAQVFPSAEAVFASDDVDAVLMLARVLTNVKLTREAPHGGDQCFASVTTGVP